MNTDTPRTDAACGFQDIDTAVSADFARSIERENAALREALETLRLVVGLTAFKHEGQRAALQDAMDLAAKALNTKQNEH